MTIFPACAAPLGRPKLMELHMSTTIEVLPGSAVLPTCAALLDLTWRRLEERLGSRAQRLHLIGELLDGEGKADRRRLAPDFRLRWEEDFYAWFSVRGVPGGTDAYFDLLDDEDRSYWLEVVSGRNAALAERIRRGVEIGHRWWFRRSAGQRGTTNLVYGYLAAALAELTDGVVFSDDSAWDYERFPALPTDFYTWYFDPQMAIDPEYGEWAARCLAGMEEDLST